MIELRNLTKIFNVRGRKTVICNNINLVVPSRTSVALPTRTPSGPT